mmetsp:Transcript_25111/g.70160  ORF Transcript_25111/g.70160 Transcript_25111/m.70160 type:complete len:354 (+) Transcript_25111:874-1935(+)
MMQMSGGFKQAPISFTIRSELWETWSAMISSSALKLLRLPSRSFWYSLTNILTATSKPRHSALKTWPKAPAPSFSLMEPSISVAKSTSRSTSMLELGSLRLGTRERSDCSVAVALATRADFDIHTNLRRLTRPEQNPRPSGVTSLTLPRDIMRRMRLARCRKTAMVQAVMLPSCCRLPACTDHSLCRSWKDALTIAMSSGCCPRTLLETLAIDSACRSALSSSARSDLALLLFIAPCPLFMPLRSSCSSSEKLGSRGASEVPSLLVLCENSTLLFFFSSMLTGVFLGFKCQNHRRPTMATKARTPAMAPPASAGTDTPPESLKGVTPWLMLTILTLASRTPAKLLIKYVLKGP